MAEKNASLYPELVAASHGIRAWKASLKSENETSWKQPTCQLVPKPSRPQSISAQTNSIYSL